MFSNELRKTWIALILLGLAAGTWLLAGVANGAGVWKWFDLVSPVLAFAGMLSCAPRGALTRTLPRIYDDVRARRQPRSSPLQAVCFVFALLLAFASLHGHAQS